MRKPKKSGRPRRKARKSRPHVRPKSHKRSKAATKPDAARRSAKRRLVSPSDVRPHLRWSETRKRVLRALALMRQGESLSTATRREHIKPSTFLRYVGAQVRRERPGGRFQVARRAHSRTPSLRVPSARGPVLVKAKSRAVRRRFSAFGNAIGHFNRTGDVSRLRPFKGKSFIAADGTRVEFVTDPKTLITLAEAGALRLDQLYASVRRRS
jgi:hypothetical protein